MQVVLMQDVAGLGHKGQVKKVAEGYAKNFLIPRNLVAPVTKGTLRDLELRKAGWARREENVRSAAQKLGKRIDTLTLRVARKAGETGKLFGSVTTQELAELLTKELGTEIDKKQLTAEHIKEIGKHEVTVKLHTDVKATFKLIVDAEEEPVATTAAS